ncbi:5'-deoxynucleotidase HDDC2-like [Impatiens glandulifera]|uniref:5'-deoxynucleotidase HDDC2-like n=1 Tax=Impatiens glandulifera TaxID=253017 RepID=UPI001FB15E53|nr:5'-deoxynucleotidase HDDC2-like [Impatiens glandulifera]
MAAHFSSISTASRSSFSPNRSIPPHRWHRTIFNFNFFNEFQTPKILSVRTQYPSSEPRNSSIVSKANGLEAGCGSEEGKDSSSTSSVIDFLTLCHSLKSTKRKGWVNHKIVGPESIADHMYRMALMALIVEDLPGVNRERCIKIAIVHDIAEAIVGDITPNDGVPKAEKSRMEQAALDEMCTILGGGLRAEEIKELWTEYETNSTLEANLVKDFDKVEMILQALEYEKEHGKVLDEFFISTAGKIQTEIGKRWAAEIHSRRNSKLGNKP